MKHPFVTATKTEYATVFEYCCPALCRYIELSNGLRVLLIADFSRTDGKGCSENGEDKVETEEEGKGEEDGDSGEGSEEEEEENKEEEQDSDFDELDEDNLEKKKKGSSEKQVGVFKFLVVALSLN